MRSPLFVFAALAVTLCGAIAAPAGNRGIDRTAMDTTVRPGDDFFLYANANWIKAAEIPAGRTATGTFQDLRIQSEQRLQDIAASLETKPKPNEEERKLRDFYLSLTNRAHIEARGLAPAKADLDAIANLKTLDDVAAMMANPRLRVGGPFVLDTILDEQNPDLYVLGLGQAGLGMPHRDYYLRTGAALDNARAAYKTHMAKMLALAGIVDSQQRAEAVYDFEHGMAEAQWADSDRRQVAKTYNPMRYAELKALAPQFPWDAFLRHNGVSPDAPDGRHRLIIMEKSAFPKLAEIFAGTPVAVLRDYMTLQYLHGYAICLPQAFDDEDFAFYQQTLRSVPRQLPIGIRAAYQLDTSMGDALGKLYVAKYFPPLAKIKVIAMTANLIAVYRNKLSTLDWMTPATRAKAIEKLDRLRVKIGYPDKWRDYSGLVISPDDPLGNVQRAELYEERWRAGNIDKPADRMEWGLTPSTVNAYSNPSWNEIVFTAGMTQPPFFDLTADDAVNYGALGTQIAHIIGESFDENGARFDASGAAISWWSPDDVKAFHAKTDPLIHQYDVYEALPGLHVNGRATLEENINDLAGLAVGLAAYHLSLGGKPAPLIDGFTGDQRFFLAFAQSWHIKSNDAYVRQNIQAGEYSPAAFRVIGATRNIDAWYAAFDVKPGDRYYLPPEQRTHLW